MLQERKKKDWLEKHTKQKKTDKETRKDREKRGRRSEKARRENGRTQGKCAKTEKSGNNYGGEIHETQLRTILHLTVAWVLELSK